MADTQTEPVTISIVTPGADTSEHALTKVLSNVSIVVMVLGAALQALPDTMQTSKYVAGALAALALITKLLATLGYNNGRAAVKVAALNLATAQAGAASASANPSPSSAPSAS